jgi:hypothetical protein
MTDPKTNGFKVPDDRPPDWANTIMRWAVSTPGVQALVGQGVALLRFTGRRSGNRYTIPVSYHREDDVVTVVTKRQRKWWHNFETPAEVEVRLAGRVFTGKAEARTDADEMLDFMTGYLAKRPIDAKAYGLKKDEVTREKIARIIPHIVVIRIELAPELQPSS